MGTQPLKTLPKNRAPALVVLDVIAFQAAFLITYGLRFRSGIFSNPLQPDVVPIALILTLFWLLLYTLRGMYRHSISTSRYEAVLEVLKTVFIGILILFLVSMDPRQPLSSSRVVLLTYGVLLVAFSGGAHALARTVIRALYQRRTGLYRSVIVGFGRRGRNLYRTLRDNPVYGHDVVAVLHDDGEDVEDSVNVPVHPVRAFTEVVQSQPGDRPLEYALITLEPSDRERVIGVIQRAHTLGLRVMIMPDFFQILVGLAKSRELYGVPLLEVFPDLIDPTSRLLKRLMDVVVSLIVLTLGLPVMLAIALAIRLDSRGPVLYRQKRVGYLGRDFHLYKFRSMYTDAEERTGAVWASEDDPRVTKVGRFLRRSRLDELPQAWNVLKGDMSLVGPRPERRFFVEKLSEEIPLYTRRLNVKPGITGWAQIRKGYDASVDDVREKLQYDLFYLENLSIGLDIKILLNTLWVMLTARGR